MLDPTFLSDLLAAPKTEQTVAFIRRLLNGILYVQASAGAPGGGFITITGQVKTQDGVSKTGTLDVLVRTTGSLVGNVVHPTTGTAQAGDGTAACWLKTASGGNFAVTIAGVGGDKVLVELLTQHGETVFLGLSF